MRTLAIASALAAGLTLSACGGRQNEVSPEDGVGGAEMVPITRNDDGQLGNDADGSASAAGPEGASARDRPDDTPMEITGGASAQDGSGSDTMTRGTSEAPRGGKASKLRKMDPAN